MVRFVLSDLPWIAGEITTDEIAAAAEALADRLEVARLRDEEVGLHPETWGMKVLGNSSLTDFYAEGGDSLPRDTRRRLLVRIERLAPLVPRETDLDEFMLPSGPAQAPGVRWAAASTEAGRGVAVLTTPKAEPRGLVDVGVEVGKSVCLHFVDDEASHVRFFRDVINREKIDTAEFADIAPSAFPELAFVPNVFRGLRDLSRPFHDCRQEVVRHFSVLSDHGAAAFAEPGARLIGAAFQTHGVDCSPETPETMADARLRRLRVRRFRDEDLVFEWHTKIRGDRDRIHIHRGKPGSGNRVIVGIICRHLDLPGD